MSVAAFVIRIQHSPVAPEQAEGAVGLHEGQLPLVERVHVRERGALHGAVALVDQPHVQSQVHVRREAEHVLLGRVLWETRLFQE